MSEEKKTSEVLSGREVALVTGASRGIGAAIAEKLAMEGYDLVMTCSDTMKDLDALCRRLEKSYGVRCRGRKVDMGDWEQVRKLFEEIGELDILVNNAGISYIGLLQDMTVEEWDHVMRVNLYSAFYTCKCAVPMMLQRGKGRILNISSVWGNVGASMEVAYSASKGGLNAYTAALAKELAPSHIAVNAIACGVIDTSMNDAFSQEEMETLRKEIPADRIGTPQEVAQMVWQILESPEYLTGQVIGLDGGWM